MGVDPDADQRWSTYLRSVLAFSLVSVLFLYGFQRVQQHLLLSLGFPAVKADQAWNTAVSFVTNTNWQSYSGESTMGHLVQMAGLAAQNFQRLPSGWRWPWRWSVVSPARTTGWATSGST